MQTATWSPELVQRDTYGVEQSNPITDEVVAIRESISGDVWLDDPKLAKITRLRLVSDPGFPAWDVSYCYGKTKDGENVRVHLPAHQFSKRNLKREIVEMCREARVYAKGIGILDADVISTLQ